ncbi:glycosyltransferase [Bacillus lacus]|uniref:Glycosyltransferase n=1 Tax=Metabacillus lacus TaxID=1983721 RepID=A0A7X2J1Q3_9BACI|nr:glycosyltransferase family 2 protein [Metabacillus lacus]MRX73721.1 glycosyltransferase [Metabacillus lacus]
MENTLPLLTIAVPCYNEEEILEKSITELTSVLSGLMNTAKISPDSRLLFIDDGSKDRTWGIIYRESIKNKCVTGIKLARNVGHQKALLAGLHKAGAVSDCVISIDADLQDDIKVIEKFVGKYHEGFDVVYGVRSSRDTDTYFKRTSAQTFYHFMNKLGIHLIYNHADCRLLSRRVLQELSHYQEENLFLRGIVPLIGYRSTEVHYERKGRTAGVSKYPLKKMLSFAFDGITSFSVAPIRMITSLGVALFFVSVLAASYALLQKMMGFTYAGWTSLMISIWFLGGLQLMGIGMIGEYIGKVFVEVKKRPKYAIDVDLYSNPSTILLEKRKELSRRKAVTYKR